VDAFMYGINLGYGENKKKNFTVTVSLNWESYACFL